LTQNDRDEVNVVVLLEVIWRYKYFIALVSGICILLAVYLALTALSIYHAETVLTEAPNGNMGESSSLASRFGGLASLAGVSLGSAGDTSRQAQAVLHSRHLAEEFVRRYSLADKLLHNSKQQNLWFAVDKFRDTVISILEVKEKGTTTVSVDWRDPEEAAKWANDYVALANELIRTRALDDSARNIKYLNEQISKTDVVEVRRVIYSLVESETKANMLANTRKEYAFTVVDPAVTPESRIWPRRTLMVISGAVLGVILGAFIALGHSMWRQHWGRKGAVA
jgi:uncharacterized protein involved in exopolysaccharide biosynthesis